MAIIKGWHERCERLARHFAESWLFYQAQKEIYSKATESIENVNSVSESESFRRVRALIYMTDNELYPLQDYSIMIRKSSDGVFSMDENTTDKSMIVGFVRMIPFGVYIINYGLSGDITLKGKPMAHNTAYLIVASTKIKIGDIEGHVKVDCDPEYVQANINLARKKYPDVCCKNCKLICPTNKTSIKLFKEGSWLSVFTTESIALEMEQWDRVDKMFPEEIMKLNIKYSQYLDAQPEPLKTCDCPFIS